MYNGYWERHFASNRLGNKRCYRQGISSPSWGSLSWMKTLAGFFSHVFNVTKKMHFLAPPESTKGHHKGLGLTKMCQYEPYWYWWAVSYKKYQLKPEFLLERTTICSKVFPLLCAQRGVLLFLCLPGTWGREIIASLRSLVERISQSPNRGCPWNKIISLCDDNSRKNSSLHFQVVPGLNFKMMMANI